jgi:hypothetical protein
VEDCEHFVPALKVRLIEVFDPKVKAIGYDERRRILEIAFKNGQTWQLQDLPPDIYKELLHQTLSSFLKFIAHRYKANPVRTNSTREAIPSSEPCLDCKNPLGGHPKTGHIGSPQNRPNGTAHRTQVFTLLRRDQARGFCDSSFEFD